MTLPAGSQARKDATSSYERWRSIARIDLDQGATARDEAPSGSSAVVVRATENER